MESLFLVISMYFGMIQTSIKVVGPFMLFGVYYGFITTLPMGPSHILAIRSQLIEGTKAGKAAVSGLMLGQVLMYLSIYLTPLYIMLIRPHLFTLLILPYLFFYWNRTKELVQYKELRSIDSISNVRLRTIFLDSLIFQLLNPGLLPSPVLTRLSHVLMFRYSGNVFFVISSIVGWLSGQILFFNLAKNLFVRIEYDSPIFYAFLKRIIHQSFSTISIFCVLLHMGRAPVPLITKKYADHPTIFDKTILEVEFEFLWFHRPWPTSFFAEDRWNQPKRYIHNSFISRQAPVKQQLADYFFDKCIIDGKERLSFTALPNLHIVKGQLTNWGNRFLDIPSEDFSYEKWINNKREKNEMLIHEFEDRIKLMKKGFSIQQAMEKRTGILQICKKEKVKKRVLPKILDPFFTSRLRASSSSLESYLLFPELKKKLTDDEVFEIENLPSWEALLATIKRMKVKETKLEEWIIDNYTDPKRAEFPLVLDLLSWNAKRIFAFILDNTKTSNSRNLYYEIRDYKEYFGTKDVQWKYVVRLHRTDKSLFSIYMERAENLKLIYASKLLQSSFDEFAEFIHLNKFKKSTGFKINFVPIQKLFILLTKFISIIKRKSWSVFFFEDIKPKFSEIQKSLARFNRMVKFDRVDIISSLTDVRQRKMKNLEIAGIDGGKLVPLNRRFSKKTDFRRRLVKGAMRPLRRKMLVWNILQYRAHSPFFFRILDISTLSKTDSVIYDEWVDQNEIISGIEIEQKKKDERRAQSARLDFSMAQNGRSLLLLFQSSFRKYIKLPLLIVSKNIGRMLLFQSPEWREDWTEWKQEVHVNCLYNGDEVVHGGLPDSWLREGFQIKIIYPFHLKPWHDHVKTNTTHSLNEVDNNYLVQIKQQEKLFSFLTPWGRQTAIPFGTVQKEPSFWKPIWKELRKIVEKGFFTVLENYSKLIEVTNIFNYEKNKKSFKTSQIDVLDNIYNNELNHASKDNFNIKDSALTNILIENRSNINTSINSEDEIESGFSERIKEYEDFSILGNEETFYSSELDKILKLEISNFSSWVFAGKKQLIHIQERLILLRRSFFDLNETWFYSIDLFCQKIKRNFFQRSFTSLNITLNVLTQLLQNINSILDEVKNQILEELNRKYNRNQKISSISQAYIIHRLWHTKTISKLDLNHLVQQLNTNIQDNKDVLDSSKQTQKDFNFINVPYEHIQDFIETRGILKDPRDFNEKDWNNWLKGLKQYNLPSKIWVKIAPLKWKVELKKYWKSTKNKIDLRSQVSGEIKIHSLYQENPQLRNRLNNLHKRSKYNELLYSFLDASRDSDIKKVSVWDTENTEGILTAKSLQKIRRLSKKKKDQLNLLSNRDIQKKNKASLDPKFILWFLPDLVQKKKQLFLETGIFVPKPSLIQKRSNTKKFQRVELFFEHDLGNTGDWDQIRELELNKRQSHPVIDQFFWQSNIHENEFTRLRDLISIMNVTKEDNLSTLSALCDKMDIDLNFLKIMSETRKLELPGLLTKKYLINKGHRRFRVLDDQILMYKTISVLLKFKKRFKKRFDKNLFSQCTTCLLVEDFEKKTNSNLYNLEDLLLPRRRRETRILRTLFSQQSSQDLMKDPADMGPIEDQKKQGYFNPLNQSQITKRFIWPSFRFEDIACMNRFWFNTNNGSRFTMLRIRMYPPIG
uniref:hypothetical chloroplast RF1 n=1 Tax=Equisetum variegatum TaxID=231678 RepID=UPI0030FF08BA